MLHTAHVVRGHSFCFICSQNDVKMVKLLLNYSYDADADVPGGKADVKPQLSKEQSRQVNQQMIPAMWFLIGCS